MEAHGTRRESRQVNGVGPTGMTVARNVARLRNARGLTTVQLAKLLEDAGRPITASSITKLELGQRKVDVDDLIVIALALRVSPTALLLPPTADQHDSTPITSAGEIGANLAWDWLLGERPLEDDLPANDDGEVWNDFQTLSRPPGRRQFRATPKDDFAENVRAKLTGYRGERSAEQQPPSNGE